VVSADLVAFQNVAREHNVNAIVLPQQFEGKQGVAGQER